jgi:hypothetical protein
MCRFELADPDTKLGSPVAEDSPLVAPRRIQTGQNPLSAMAKNFVPQTGQVRAPGSLPVPPQILQIPLSRLQRSGVACRTSTRRR